MLDERKTAILRAIVHEYIATAQPVGSTHIAQAPGVGVDAGLVELVEAREPGGHAFLDVLLHTPVEAGVVVVLHGHEVGDQLLQENVHNLQEIARLFPLARSLEVQRAIAGILIRSDTQKLERADLARTLRQHRLKSPDGSDVIDMLIRVLQST